MWCTRNLHLKPVMVQISSISSVTVPCWPTSMSSNLSNILFPSFLTPLSLSDCFSTPALGRLGNQLVRLDNLEGHPPHPTMQRLHLVGLLGPALEGGFAQVAGYGSGHYGRFMKDLGHAPRC